MQRCSLGWNNLCWLHIQIAAIWRVEEVELLRSWLWWKSRTKRTNKFHNIRTPLCVRGHQRVLNSSRPRIELQTNSYLTYNPPHGGFNEGKENCDYHGRIMNTKRPWAASGADDGVHIHAWLCTISCPSLGQTCDWGLELGLELDSLWLCLCSFQHPEGILVSSVHLITTDQHLSEVCLKCKEYPIC